MIEIRLDDKAICFCGLMILAFLPQIHLLLIFLIMDLNILINQFKMFLNKNLKF